MTNTITSVALWRRVLLVSLAGLVAALAVAYGTGTPV